MNISLTSLEEAWGPDFKIENTASHNLKKNNIYKSKKHQKQMLKRHLDMEDSVTDQPGEDNTITLRITDDKIVNYLKRYTNEYRLLHVTELLEQFISKNYKLHELNEDNNDVSERMLVYILLLLIGVLLFDRVIKYWKNI